MVTTLIAVVSVNHEVTGQYASKLTSLALAVFLKSHNSKRPRQSIAMVLLRLLV